MKPAWSSLQTQSFLEVILYEDLSASPFKQNEITRAVIAGGGRGQGTGRRQGQLGLGQLYRPTGLTTLIRL